MANNVVGYTNNLSDVVEYTGGETSTATVVVDNDAESSTYRQIRTYVKPEAISSEWGGITGDIEDQEDLQEALDLKANSADLATVATTGKFTDLVDAPFKTVNDDHFDVISGDLQLSNGVTTKLAKIPTIEEGLRQANVNIEQNSEDIDLLEQDKQDKLTAGFGINISTDSIIAVNRDTVLDYNSLTNLPKVNGVELKGNKTLDELGTYTKEESDGKFSLITEAGNKIDLEINSADYKLVAKLYDKNNNLISTSSVIDLPLEQLVVSVTFDSETNELVITLKNGSVTRVPLGSIITGLATQTWVSQQIANEDTTLRAWADGKFLTEHQSLSAYRKAADQDTIDNTKVDKSAIRDTGIKSVTYTQILTFTATTATTTGFSYPYALINQTVGLDKTKRYKVVISDTENVLPCEMNGVSTSDEFKVYEYLGNISLYVTTNPSSGFYPVRTTLDFLLIQDRNSDSKWELLTKTAGTYTVTIYREDVSTEVLPNEVIYGQNFSPIKLKDNGASTFSSVSIGGTNFATNTRGTIAIGDLNTVSAEFAIALGDGNIASNENAMAIGHSNTASGHVAFAAGCSNTASGELSFTEGYKTTASGTISHAEGQGTVASGYGSHAEGWSSTAGGQGSHAEGIQTTASVDGAHAEGYKTIGRAYFVHAEGVQTSAGGYASHAEGVQSYATGLSSHVEGMQSYAGGESSHAEGAQVAASGMVSHAEGRHTIAASDYQHVQGVSNVEDSEGNYADIVGWGTVDSEGAAGDRKNISALTTGGTLRLKGDVYTGCNDDSTGGNKLVSNLTDLGITATSNEINILDGVTATTTELNYVDGVTSSIQSQLDAKEPADATILKKADVVNNVTTEASDRPLSASMGKSLQTQVDALKSVGKFLSLWNCTTGKPVSDPSTLPYTYNTGDYYRISVIGGGYTHTVSLSGTEHVGLSFSVQFSFTNSSSSSYTTIPSLSAALYAAGHEGHSGTCSATGSCGEYEVRYVASDAGATILMQDSDTTLVGMIADEATGITIVDTVTGGTTNYKPDGSSYTGAASTVVDTTEVQIGWIYYYDGTNWLKQASGQQLITDVKVNNTSVVVNKVAEITVPTKTSELTNDSGYITSSYHDSTKANASDVYTKTESDTLLNAKVDKITGKGLSEEDFTSTLKTKLDGIESGAEVNDIDDVQVNGTSVVTEKVANVTVPTKTTDLANDSGFITKLVNDLENYYLKTSTYTKTEVNTLIAAIKQFTYEVVEVLPTASASTMNKIYLVPSSSAKTQNVKDEFITIQNGENYAWEQIGTTAIDLSNYYTKSQTDNLLGEKQDTISDLSNIRSGAAAGATAIQPDDNVSELTNDAHYLTSTQGTEVGAVTVNADTLENHPASYFAPAATAESTANKTSVISSSSTTTQYPNAYAVNEAIEDVREVAEGKTATYVVSCTTNTELNSQASSITLTQNLVDINGNTITLSSLKLGDNIYITETDVPDRWYAGNNVVYKLETAKVPVNDVQVDGTSVVNNNIAFIPLASTQTNGAMSSSDKSKLEGIESGAEVNDVNSVDGETGNVVLNDVKFTAQSLTTAQQSQARDNIGAPSSASINSSGLITFSNSGGTSLFTLQLPIYSGGVQWVMYQ